MSPGVGPTDPPLPPDVPGRTGSPAQRLDPRSRRFVLAEPAEYLWWHPLDDPERRVYRLVVDEGFDHDFATVPRALWVLIAPVDLGLASIWHDWLYRAGGRRRTDVWDETAGGWSEVTEPDRWTRRQADDLFARMMREQGVPRWRRRWAWRAVHWLGRGAWRGPS